MERFEYQPAGSCRVVFGPGTSGPRLAEELARLGASRVLVVASAREVRRVVAPLDDLGRIVAGVITDVREHVPQTVARTAQQAATDVGADALLAVGGGSAIGTAKAVALTTGLPILAVPTTFSGSEVTPVWGLTDEHGKRTGTDPRVLPRIVVYDPELATSLPTDMAVASAFNAIAHGVEALWAPGRNPASGALALAGIGSLAEGLRKDDRAVLMRGGWLAASAFGITGSGLHHKLCHVLGGTVGLPHAPTHAIVLPHVAAFNLAADRGTAAGLADALGTSDALDGLRHLGELVGAPTALQKLGMREEQIDEVVALTLPNVPADNPAPVTEAALRELVCAAWAGDPPWTGR